MYTGPPLSKRTNHGGKFGLVPVFSYRLRWVVGFGLVEIAVSTNRRPVMGRGLCGNAVSCVQLVKAGGDIFRSPFSLIRV